MLPLNKRKQPEPAVDKLMSLHKTKGQLAELLKQAVKACREKHMLTHELYATLIKLEFPKDQCVLSPYVPSKGPGSYSQVRYLKEKYYLHRAAALHAYDTSGGKVEDLPVNWEGSHWYCHNAECFNVHHLWPEDGEVNKSRLCCKLHANLVGYKCPHKPACHGCISVFNVAQ